MTCQVTQKKQRMIFFYFIDAKANEIKKKKRKKKENNSLSINLEKFRLFFKIEFNNLHFIRNKYRNFSLTMKTQQE